ncbi:MAG: tRNA (guanosine(37)-N1)-methyltransferase TrmD [Thermoanaerobaculia bacterium]
MRITVLTIFPELFPSFLAASLLGKAIERGLLEVAVRDLRDWAPERHRTVDDLPYGGGGGMVMTAPPWIAAVRAVAGPATWRVLLSPQGRPLTDEAVRALAGRPELMLLCGRYEGLDERVRATVVDEEISLGDFVLSGGEVAAMAVIEAVARQLPGVVQLASSIEEESFRQGLLDTPHYTRPPVVEGLEAPAVLRSGDHAAVAAWRRREALRATLVKRPDQLARARLTPADRQALAELAAEEDRPLPVELVSAAEAEDNRQLGRREGDGSGGRGKGS